MRKSQHESVMTFYYEDVGIRVLRTDIVIVLRGKLERTMLVADALDCLRQLLEVIDLCSGACVHEMCAD